MTSNNLGNKRVCPKCDAKLNQITIDPSRDRVLRLPDVKARTGLSRSSIYAYINVLPPYNWSRE